MPRHASLLVRRYLHCLCERGTLKSRLDSLVNHKKYGINLQSRCSLPMGPFVRHPPIQIHPKTPSCRRKNATASRDQKRHVQMAARCGLNTQQIMEMLRLTQRQVLYALDTPATPKKSTGKPPILNAESVLISSSLFANQGRTGGCPIKS
jgi:hypothetical protein